MLPLNLNFNRNFIKNILQNFSICGIIKEQSRAEQSRAEQSRAEQSRAEAIIALFYQLNICSCLKGTLKL